MFHPPSRVWRTFRQILLAVPLVVLSGIPLRSAPVLIEGSAEYRGNGLDGTLREIEQFEFRVAVSGREFRIDRWVENNTNSSLQSIKGNGPQGPYLVTLNPTNRAMLDSVELMPPIGREISSASLRFDMDAWSKIVWIAFCSQAWADHSPQKVFNLTDDIRPFAWSEVRYDIERAAPGGPVSFIRASSLPWREVPGPVVRPGSLKSLLPAWTRRKRVPLLPPFEKGKPLWEYHATKWTNAGGTMIPLEFTFRRESPYVDPGGPLVVSTNAIVVVTGRVTSVAQASAADLSRPVLDRDLPMVDWRFGEILGELPLIYTNASWTDAADPGLRALALRARENYLKLHERNAASMPPSWPYPPNLSALLALFTLGLGVYYVRRRRANPGLRRARGATRTELD